MPVVGSAACLQEGEGGSRRRRAAAGEQRERRGRFARQLNQRDGLVVGDANLALGDGHRARQAAQRVHQAHLQRALAAPYPALPCDGNTIYCYSSIFNYMSRPYGLGLYGLVPITGNLAQMLLLHS